jgi:hypothetical protein
MNPMKLLQALAVLVALALPAVVAAATDDSRFVAAHDVKITGPGFDFGGNAFVAGAPTRSGELEFWTKDGLPTPALEGTLHLNDVEGACARMKLDYQTSAGTTFATRYGGEVCVDDDRHHEFDVSLSPYGGTKIGKVKVTLQRLFASGSWTAVGSQTVRFGPYEDSVKIKADGVDFGNGNFVGSAPTGSGALVWSYDQAKVHADLTGSIHLNKLAGVCARIKIDYRDGGGDLLGSDVGGSMCAPDNDHHEWTVDLGTFADADVVQANVRLQTLGSDGTWRNAGRSQQWFSSESRVRWG